MSEKNVIQPDNITAPPASAPKPTDGKQAASAMALQAEQGRIRMQIRPFENLGGIVDLFRNIGDLGNVRTLLSIIPDIRSYIDAIAAGDDTKARSIATSIMNKLGSESRLSKIIEVFTTGFSFWNMVKGFFGTSPSVPAVPATGQGGTLLRMPVMANHLPALAASVDFLERACRDRIAENVSYPPTIEEIAHGAHVFEAVSASL